MNQSSLTMFNGGGHHSPDSHAAVRELRAAGCPHPEEACSIWPVPSGGKLPDGHDWEGKHPVYCSDCKDFIDRIPP